MNDQFSRQAQDMFNAARDAKIPENIQALAEDNVARSREVYQRFNSAAKDGAKVVEEVVLTAQAGAKAIGEKMLTNTAVNTEAVFDAAQAIARARSLPEAMRMQAEFFQQQFTVAGAQTKELMELSTKVARQTIESMNAAAQRSFDQAKKV